VADTVVYVVILLLPVLLAVALWVFARSVARRPHPRPERPRGERRRTRTGSAAGRKGERAPAAPAARAEADVGWGRILGVNLLVFLLGTAILVAGFETYYRFIYDSTDSFGLTRTTEEWWMRHSHANKAGVRDDVEYALKRTPGRPRITFLGDSFTAGHGVKNVGDRFPNLVRTERPAWEIQVFAKSGLDTGAEVHLLQDTIRKGYDLDRVLLVYVLNDISDIVPEWNAIVNRIKDKGHTPGFLVQHSYLMNILYYRLKAMRDPDISNYYGFLRNAYEGQVWENHRQRLVRLKELVEANGGHLLVTTFPFLHAIGPGYQYRPVHAKLDALWKELGVPHLDLLDVYGALPSRSLVVNGFDAHPNEHAHRLAATAIEEFLDHHVESAP
jgi:hypothetical protein